MKIQAVHKKIAERGDVILCPTCKGRGWNWSNLDFGDYPGDERKIDCASCGANGRVRTVTVEADIIVPYNWELNS